MKITKAVIAVAGYGTRFLPATKNQPKEMLPIVDKPIIQYLVEEAVNSGIKEIILVTRFGQSALENHFDTNYELEQVLSNTGKTDYLKKIQEVYQMANFIYVRQGRHLPYGNGTPLLVVKNLIAKNESFVFMFGDDLVKSDVPCVKQLINEWEQKDNNPIIACQEIEKKEVSRYGILKLDNEKDNKIIEAVEKPNPDDVTPPYLAQFGRFILNDEIIKITDEKYKNNSLGKDNELWLIDSIIEYMKNKPVYAKKIAGEWMTTGDPLRFMQTSIKYALDRPDIGSDLKAFIKNLNI